MRLDSRFGDPGVRNPAGAGGWFKIGFYGYGFRLLLLLFPVRLFPELPPEDELLFAGAGVCTEGLE